MKKVINPNLEFYSEFEDGDISVKIYLIKKRTSFLVKYFKGTKLITKETIGIPPNKSFVGDMSLLHELDVIITKKLEEINSGKDN